MLENIEIDAILILTYETFIRIMFIYPVNTSLQRRKFYGKIRKII